MYTAKLQGTLPMDLILAAETHGLRTDMVRGDLTALRMELDAGRPVLAMIDVGLLGVVFDHYVVVTGWDEERQGLYMHSAGHENQFVSYKKFMRGWEKTDFWMMRARLS
jgi:hypothetical protein